jgi:hypothetical protein
MSRAPWPQHKKIDFSQADWSRPNKEIAFELKCDPSLASRRRRPNLKVGHTPVNFSKVDWGLPVKAIAHELGCSEAYVYSNRPKDFRLRHRAYDFSKVDWTRTNEQIAKEVGCCEQLVRVRRPKGVKPALIHRVNLAQTLSRNSRRLRVSEKVLRKCLKDAGVKLPRKRSIRKIDPSQFNWRACNDAEIARAAGVSSQAVASYRRYHNLPRPLEKWRMIDPRLTIRENAKKLGRSEASVYSMAHSRGMRFKKIKPGRPRSRSPLTPAQ